MNTRKGIYAGSFDLATEGHRWVISEGARLFDHLTVAIGENPGKKYLFTIKERLEMLREITSEWSNVSVDYFSQRYLIEYASESEATHILRGIRGADDFRMEKTIRYINDDIAHTGDDESRNITTVYVIPPRHLVEVSSSAVKGLVGGDPNWREVVRKYVPASVLDKLEKKLALEKNGPT